MPSNHRRTLYIYGVVSEADPRELVVMVSDTEIDLDRGSNDVVDARLLEVSSIIIRRLSELNLEDVLEITVEGCLVLTVTEPEVIGMALLGHAAGIITETLGYESAYLELDKPQFDH